MPVDCDGFIKTILLGHHQCDTPKSDTPRKLTPAYNNAVEYKARITREDKSVGVKDNGTQKRLEKSNNYCTIS